MEEENKMDEQESLNPEESEETENTEEVVEGVEETPETPQSDKLQELYRNQKVRAEKAEAERKALEEKLNKLMESDKKEEKGALDIEDYIDISASLEGLDQKEKTYLAREHKLTGKSLAEIRQDEDFKLWQSAYRKKVEKEQRNLAPSGTQSESSAPQSLAQRLAKASSLEEKEQILVDAGLYKQKKNRPDKRKIENY